MTVFRHSLVVCRKPSSIRSVDRETFDALPDSIKADRGVGHRAAPVQQPLMAIVVRRVAGRPDRFEPRMTRKGPRGYESLTRPRKEIKLQMLKRARKI